MGVRILGMMNQHCCFYIPGLTIGGYLVLKFTFQGVVRVTQVLVETLGSVTMAVAIC